MDYRLRTFAAIKGGVIADQTGLLSFVGRANANVARMVIDELNAKGGLLGRKLELYLEDSATDDSVAAAKAEQTSSLPGGLSGPGVAGPVTSTQDAGTCPAAST